MMRNIIFTVDDFIEYAKGNPMMYNHYCEVLISNTGYVILAQPSHQEALISNACEILHCTREELENNTPTDYYCDYDIYLMKITNTIMVYYNIQRGLKLTKFQKRTLKKLEDNGLIQYNFNKLRDNPNKLNFDFDKIKEFI